MIPTHLVTRGTIVFLLNNCSCRLIPWVCLSDALYLSHCEGWALVTLEAGALAN